MRIDNTSDREKKKKKKEDKRKSSFENMIFSIMEKSLKSALDQAIDELLKDFK